MLLALNGWAAAACWDVDVKLDVKFIPSRSEGGMLLSDPKSPKFWAAAEGRADAKSPKSPKALLTGAGPPPSKSSTKLDDGGTEATEATGGAKAKLESPELLEVAVVGAVVEPKSAKSVPKLVDPGGSKLAELKSPKSLFTEDDGGLLKSLKLERTAGAPPRRSVSRRSVTGAGFGKAEGLCCCADFF